MCLSTFTAAGIAAMASTSATHANAAARFELVNASGRPIDVVYISSVSSANWCGDLLRGGVLSVGSRVVITPGPAGCMFDVRVGYQGGGTEAFRNVDLCRVSRISFADGPGSTAR